jgi:hypothetical protein
MSFCSGWPMPAGGSRGQGPDDPRAHRQDDLHPALHSRGRPPAAGPTPTQSGRVARHALARWLFFANRGEFRSGDYEEIMNKASCLSLLSNAVLVWNTVAMMKIITQLRAAGENIVDENLARISPLMYQTSFPTEPIILPVPTRQVTISETAPTKFSQVCCCTGGGR